MVGHFVVCETSQVDGPVVTYEASQVLLADGSVVTCEASQVMLAVCPVSTCETIQVLLTGGYM